MMCLDTVGYDHLRAFSSGRPAYNMSEGSKFRSIRKDLNTFDNIAIIHPSHVPGHTSLILQSICNKNEVEGSRPDGLKANPGGLAETSHL